jgi:hypothetical protein
MATFKTLDLVLNKQTKARQRPTIMHTNLNKILRERVNWKCSSRSHGGEINELLCTRVYPKVSELVAWNENCKWYSSLPLGAVIYRYFVSQSSQFCHHNPMCCFSMSVYCLFCYQLSPETFGYTLVCTRRTGTHHK